MSTATLRTLRSIRTNHDRPVSTLTYTEQHFDKLHNYLYHLLSTNPKRTHAQTQILNRLNTLNFLYTNPGLFLKYIDRKGCTEEIKENLCHEINEFLRESVGKVVMGKRDEKSWNWPFGNSTGFQFQKGNTSYSLPKRKNPFSTNNSMPRNGFENSQDCNLLTGINTPPYVNNTNQEGINNVEQSISKSEFLEEFTSRDINGKKFNNKINKNKFGLYTEIETFQDRTYAKTYRKGIHNSINEDFLKHRQTSRGDYGLHVIKLCLMDKISLPFWGKVESNSNKFFSFTSKKVDIEEYRFNEMCKFLQESYKETDTTFQLTEKARKEIEKNKLSDIIFTHGMVFCSTQKKVYSIFLMALLENRDDIIKFLLKRSSTDKQNTRHRTDLSKSETNKKWYVNYLDLNSNVFCPEHLESRNASEKYVELLTDQHITNENINSRDASILSLLYANIVTNGPTFYNMCLAKGCIDIFSAFEKYQPVNINAGYSNISNALLIQLDGTESIPAKHLSVYQKVNNHSVQTQDINLYITNEQYALFMAYVSNFDELEILNKEENIKGKLEKRFKVLENRLEMLNSTQQSEKINNNEIQYVECEYIVPTYLHLREWIFKTNNFKHTAQEIEKSLNSDRFHEKILSLYQLFEELIETYKYLENCLGHKYKIEEKRFLKDISTLIKKSNSKQGSKLELRLKNEGNNGYFEISDVISAEQTYRVVKNKLRETVELLVSYKENVKGYETIYENLFQINEYAKCHFYKNNIGEVYKKRVNHSKLFENNIRFIKNRKISKIKNIQINKRMYLTDLLLMKYTDVKKNWKIFNMAKYQSDFDEMELINDHSSKFQERCFLYQTDLQATMLLVSYFGILGMNPLTTFERRLTPLHMAAYAGNVDTLMFHLKYQDVNVQDTFGYFPLDYTMLEVFNRRCYTILKISGGRSKFEEEMFGSEENVELYKLLEKDTSFVWMGMDNLKQLIQKYRSVTKRCEDYIGFYFERHGLFDSQSVSDKDTYDSQNVTDSCLNDSVQLERQMEELNVLEVEQKVKNTEPEVQITAEADIKVGETDQKPQISEEKDQKTKEIEKKESYEEMRLKQEHEEREQIRKIKKSSFKFCISTSRNLFYAFCNNNVLSFTKIREKDKNTTNCIIKLQLSEFQVYKNEKFEIIEEDSPPNFKNISKYLKKHQVEKIDLQNRFMKNNNVLHRRMKSKLNRNTFFFFLHLPFITPGSWLGIKKSLSAQILCHVMKERPYDNPYFFSSETEQKEFSIGFYTEKHTVKNNYISIDLMNLRKRLFSLNMSSDPETRVTLKNGQIFVKEVFLPGLSSLHENYFNLYLCDMLRNSSEKKVETPAEKLVKHLRKGTSDFQIYASYLPWSGLNDSNNKAERDSVFEKLLRGVSKCHDGFDFNRYFRTGTIKTAIKKKREWIKLDGIDVLIDVCVEGTDLFERVLF